jgi:asparagine synthase (glutamine-hydrolysing)
VARDRLGIKPLYFVESGGRLLFASELKALLQLPEVEMRLSWSAVSHLLSFLSTPATESILDGVRKLQPGHVLTARPGKSPLSSATGICASSRTTAEASATSWNACANCSRNRSACTW